MAGAAAQAMRADKWLCFARFFRTRSAAADLILTGRLRLNGLRTTKIAQPVRPGDILTFPQGREIRVVRVLSLPLRRGPATEAAATYEDLAPRASSESVAAQGRDGVSSP